MDTMIEYLIIAWILSWFNFDEVIINGMKEIFNINISSSGYFLIFALVGIIHAFIKTFTKAV